MMKRIWSVTVAAVLVAAVCVAAPASAQAPLGLSIDPHEGFPGDVVDGMVNTDDIANSCATTVEEIQEPFFDVAYTMAGNDLPLIHMWFPDYPDVDVLPAQNYDQLAYLYIFAISFGIGLDFPDGTALTALDNSHVLTFADIATQDPVGQTSTFDQNTGLGSVIVPNVDPGLWAVAAACIEPDINLLGETIDTIAPILEADARPLDTLLDEETLEYLNDHAVQFLQPFVTPVALGLQLFTVLADLNDFVCYRAHTPDSNQMPVTVEDQFGVYSGTVHSPIDLCAPADKNGADPEATSSGDFLTSYTLSVPGPIAQPAGTAVATVVASNQFGSITLGLKQPTSLLVPTEVEGCPPLSGFLNHFNCYSLRVADDAAAPPGLVTVTTKFEGPVKVEPRKPERLCVPASKNGGPVIASFPENLLCYDVTGGKNGGNDGGGLKPAQEVMVANQFGTQEQRLQQRRELCVGTALEQ